jgi:hypothetical protein
VKVGPRERTGVFETDRIYFPFTVGKPLDRTEQIFHIAGKTNPNPLLFLTHPKVFNFLHTFTILTLPPRQPRMVCIIRV